MYLLTREEDTQVNLTCFTDLRYLKESVIRNQFFTKKCSIGLNEILLIYIVLIYFTIYYDDTKSS